MIPPQELKKIKENLFSQIKNNFPPEKQTQILNYISSLNDSDLEKFLEKEKLIKQKCIFCEIGKDKLPSFKIGENEKAIAVLELNPISEGHILIIPKEHISEESNLPPEIFILSEKIKEKINLFLKPKKILEYLSVIFGHQILNLLPVYTSENSESPRKNLSKEELKILQKRFQEIPKKTEKNIEEKKSEEEISKKNTWLPKRKLP